MGSWLVASKNLRVSAPLTPVPVKYSFLARKCTWRESWAGMKMESETERWLLARMAPPCSGMLSSPFTQGRNSSWVTGATTKVLANQ